MPPDTPIVRAFRIYGRVQGVGYRYWTYQTAVSYSLRGTVQNMTDGSVQVIAYGTPDTIEAFTAELQSGPPAALVQRIEETPSPAHEIEIQGFSIIS